MPQTAEEYEFNLQEFIQTNLKGPEGFLDPSNPFVKELSKNAAEKAGEVVSEYGLLLDETPKLVQLALYDFVILCGKAYFVPLSLN